MSEIYSSDLNKFESLKEELFRILDNLITYY